MSDPYDPLTDYGAAEGVAEEYAETAEGAAAAAPEEYAAEYYAEGAAEGADGDGYVYETVEVAADDAEALAAAYAVGADAEAAPYEAEVDAVGEGDAGEGDAGEAVDAPTHVPPPETGERAEVIVVTTSLGSSRSNFFNSRRAVQLLACKGVVYYVIDANRDFSSATAFKDQEYLQQWTAEGLLLTADKAGEATLILPQILIDGVAIGDNAALQDMEEDFDLDWTLKRAACPACFNEREAGASACAVCGAAFRVLIAPEDVAEMRVARFLRGQPFYEVEYEAAAVEDPQVFQGHSKYAEAKEAVLRERGGDPGAAYAEQDIFAP